MERLSADKDYYRILGVSPDSDGRTIAEAYRKLIKAIHPDAHPGQSEAGVGRRVAELAEAWKVLGNEARRAEYDRARVAEFTSPAATSAPARQRPPSLRFTPDSLDLGVVRRGEVATGRVRVDNLGGPSSSLEQVGKLLDWISAYQSDAFGLTVKVDSARLSSRFSYEAELIFRLVDQSSGVASQDETLSVSVQVAPTIPARPIVRPGSWLLKRPELAGAPRTLVLDLLVGNEGEGALSGCVYSSPWIKVSPAEFGPQHSRSDPTRVLVEVDCGAWRRAGWADGKVWVSTDSGDLRQVVLIADRGEKRAPKLPGFSIMNWCALAIGAVALLPLLVLSLGLPALAAAAAPVGGFRLPKWLADARRWETINRGASIRADGWEAGPPTGSRLFWSLIASWMVVGATLGGFFFSRTAPQTTPLIPIVLGAMVAAIAGMSMIAKDGVLFRASSSLGPLGTQSEALAGISVPSSWALMGGLSFTGVSSVASWEMLTWGAALGWLTGSLAVCTRSFSLPVDWKRPFSVTVWSLSPLMVGIAGLACGRLIGSGLGGGLLYVLGWPAGGAAASATIVSFPVFSLCRSLEAGAAGLGLLSGYALGIASLLSVLEWGTPAAKHNRGHTMLLLLHRNARALLAGYSELTRGACHGTGRSEARSLLRRAEGVWSPLLVGGLAASLLLYSAVNLLLAIAAVIGLMAR